MWPVSFPFLEDLKQKADRCRRLNIVVLLPLLTTMPLIAQIAIMPHLRLGGNPMDIPAPPLGEEGVNTCSLAAHSVICLAPVGLSVYSKDLLSMQIQRLKEASSAHRRYHLPNLKSRLSPNCHLYCLSIVLRLANRLFPLSVDIVWRAMVPWGSSQLIRLIPHRLGTFWRGGHLSPHELAWPITGLCLFVNLRLSLKLVSSSVAVFLRRHYDTQMNGERRKCMTRYGRRGCIFPWSVVFLLELLGFPSMSLLHLVLVIAKCRRARWIRSMSLNHQGAFRIPIPSISGPALRDRYRLMAESPCKTATCAEMYISGSDSVDRMMGGIEIAVFLPKNAMRLPHEKIYRACRAVQMSRF